MQDMATVVFWQPFWQPSLNLLNPKPTNQFIVHVIAFLDPEKHTFDTKILFLTDVGSVICYFRILVAILVAILELTNNKLLYQCDKYSIGFHDPENIPLDTKPIFLTALESKICLFVYFIILSW